MNTLNSAINMAVPLIEQSLEMSMPLNEDLFRRMVLDELVKLENPATRSETEYPHPNIPGARVDAAILDGNGTPQTAIEFKYHRRNPNPKSATTHSENAGELLNDFARLRDFPNVQRFVMYLTDDEMLNYFKKPGRGLQWILEPKNEQEISGSKIPDIKTLRAKAGDWSRPALSQMLLNLPVASDHRLIVWQVKPKPQDD